MSGAQILRDALALPPEERARLADELLRSVDQADRADIDAAWAEEAERRTDDFEKGLTRAEPLEDVLRSIEARRP